MNTVYIEVGGGTNTGIPPEEGKQEKICTLAPSSGLDDVGRVWNS